MPHSRDKAWTCTSAKIANTWTADFTVNGKRFRKSTKQTTKAKAGEVAAEFLRQAQRNESPVRKGQMTGLRQFAEDRFLPFVGASSLAQQSKLYYQAGWRMLKSMPVADLRLDSITTSVADTLELKGTGSNQNCALRTLRRMLSLAHEYGILQAAPRIKLRKENQRTAVWDAKSEETLLKLAPQPLKDVFLVCHDSGMRPDEVISLRWDDILWNKSLIFVREGKTRKSTRHVPLSDRVRNALRVRAQHAKSEWVFPSRNKKCKTGHITHTAIEKPFRKARKDAGLPKELVLYSARHSFATDLLDRTGNLKLVMDVLGHESVTTTQKYLHPALKNVADVVNQRNEGRAAEVVN
ncbi:site-specific integrase [Acidobacterium sp. S8]|uniref:tyrosine-type recombinase/integrase n=1 Tax=Acidobacterium sp. S8 TaxID=1641854 RepID=UPI00131A6D82|nr:site-specific integrase [Acidobacterium sp. S8]